MKLLKKPFFAVLICAVVVIAATLTSVKIKFGAECQEITNLFYDGMVYEGQWQDGIAKHLKDIYTACDNIYIIAEENDCADEDFKYRSEDLRLALTYSPDDASYIYYCYDELLSELRQMAKSMSNADLSDAELEELDIELETIAQAQELINQSSYNQAVREFLRGVPEFPTEELADMAGVYLPKYFG